MNILVLNGPNLNLLGTREPEQYGHASLSDVEADCFQSNHEGELIDKIHAFGKLVQAGQALGAVFNPGGFTHTSVALHDAIKGTGLPVVEVHISNVHAREAFRHHSYVSPVAMGVVAGLGIQGYALAIQGLVHQTTQK